METTKDNEINHYEEDCKEREDSEELLSSLPKENGWRTSHLYLYQNFWCTPKEILAIMSFQQHFVAHDTDLILATMPKSGTTWLKALAFAIVNRKNHNSISNNHPLLTSNPHDLVPFFEYQIYTKNQVLDRTTIQSPTLFASHVPYQLLPESIQNSECCIVYLCRNPYDTFMSCYHFLEKLRPERLGPLLLDNAFDMFCRGVLGFGPYWDHVLGYWKESLDKPNKVLFLKYEDLKEDIVFHMKRLAKFMRFPFSLQEEREGLIEDISRLCSFSNLKELEVNKSGMSISPFKNKYMFRKGEVGDWKNHLTPQMVERLRNVIEEKLGGSGLIFKNCL